VDKKSSHRQEPVGDDVAKRLSRVAGHTVSLGRMWEEGRDCDDMLIQIAAVRAALNQIARLILNHHIDHCLESATKSGDSEASAKELKKALDQIL
jgi:DNA-binding FrmR family transcriptional regulator